MAYRARTTCTNKNFGIGFLSSIKASLALILIISLFYHRRRIRRSCSAGDDDLVKLFEQWRAFVHPVVKNNVSDYSIKAEMNGLDFNLRFCVHGRAIRHST